ncbi:MAG: type II secretion system protein [Methylococcales bacterium]|nr:type II secretion system protein [Methylococcales bacterium]
MYSIPPKKQIGFTLIEMMMVLLIIGATMKIVAVSFEDIGFSARYEQTISRLDSIRQAIVGNPKRTINGQPDISGFVSDMGRLPINVRELIHLDGYCLADNSWDNETECINVAKGNSTWVALCSDNSFPDKDSCEINNKIWSGRKSFGFCLNNTFSNEKTCENNNVGDWQVIFYGGWNGPYLTVSDSPDKADTYTDGWGNESADNNYGWDLNHTVAGSYQNLEIMSLGKNAADDLGVDCGANEYDGDCLNSISVDDYVINISSITAMFQKDYGGTTAIIPPVSFCSNSSTANNASRAVCEGASFEWFGGCDVQGYFNKADCEDVLLGNSTWYNCADKVSPTESICVAAGSVWYGTIGYGTDTWTKFYLPTSYTSKSICMILFYRKDDGTTGQHKSTTLSIKETGSYESVKFNFPSVDIPFGNNAMGIYEYDIDCNPDNTKYPSDRKVISVLFTPRKTINTINW